MTMSWLQNSSLPVTALSCRYAQTLLQNYLQHPETRETLVDCTLYDDRVHRGKPKYEDNLKEYLLVHQVLRSYLLVLLKWIGCCVQVGLNVLYEEEDLTTRTLELDLLTAVPFGIVVEEVEKSSEWIKNNLGETHAGVLQDYLGLAISMLDVHRIFSINLSLTQRDVVENQLGFTQAGRTHIERIQRATELWKMEPPKGTFSQFIQLDLSNKSIPAELTCLSREKTFSSITSLFNEVHLFILTAAKITNTYQFSLFLEYYVRRPGAFTNAISRGLFQLFLVRDTLSVLGSPDVVLSVSLKLMEDVSCQFSSVLRPDSWNIQGDPTQTFVLKQDILQRLESLLSDIETGVYQNICIVSNNPCRQRQLNTRAVLLWDTVQSNCEPFEVSLWQNHRIGNRLGDDSPALPLTSYVYFAKLDVMLQVLLSGFEQDIYKAYEMNQMYWYATYLCMTIHEHLLGRVLQTIKQQIHEISDAMPKRLKKMKAGPKKQHLKTQLVLAQAQLPKLQSNRVYVERYLAPKYHALRVITDAFRMIYALCHALNLIDAIAGPSHLLTSRRLLYGIRMKPWSSVGVPALPSYDQYENSLRISTNLGTVFDQIVTATARLMEARSLYQQLSRAIEGNLESGSKSDDPGTDCPTSLTQGTPYFLKSQSSAYYTAMEKTCVAQSLQLRTLRQAVAEQTPASVIIEHTGDPFPMLKFSF